jgi:UDP-2-acetamido-3-amino-2,3-dideoxy-glucuronate N-acetyltransferase
MHKSSDGGIRVACVGAGYWGKNLVRVFRELGALDLVCDTNPVQLKEVAGNARSTTSLRDVLDDERIDAVCVATPALTHARTARAALEAGKHVFVEKPLAISSREARALADFAAERQRVLMVGHLLWYHSAVLELKSLIDKGELGRVLYIYSNRLNLGKIRREENILWSFAPHDISVTIGLLGEMPERVYSQGGNYLHEQIADVTVTTLAFPSGVRAHVFVSWLHPYKEQKLIVVGDKKMAVFDDMAEDKLVLFPHTIEWRGQFPLASKAQAEPVPLAPSEPLKEEAAHFLDCIRSGAKPRTDAEEGIRVLEVLDACQRSLETGDTVSLAPSSVTGHPYFAHATAVVDEGAQIGPGTKVWHFAHVCQDTTIGANCSLGQNVYVGPGVRIGNGVKIQNNVSVYEGVTLDEYVFCGPSMVFTNVTRPRSAFPTGPEGYARTRVDRGATLGANCTVVCGTTVGAWSFVAAGAVVTKDVAAHSLVAGVPAKHIGWVSRAGHRLAFENGEARCPETGHRYVLRDGRALELDQPRAVDPDVERRAAALANATNDES